MMQENLNVDGFHVKKEGVLRSGMGIMSMLWIGRVMVNELRIWLLRAMEVRRSESPMSHFILKVG